MPMRWSGFGKAKNDDEAGSSSGRRRRRYISPPPSPPSPPSPPAPAPFELAPPGGALRDRVYVRKEDCQWYWDHATPLPWPDVKLPDNWHLNPQRIPVPPMPASERAQAEEIERRRRRLPTRLRNDPAFAATSPNWVEWFSDEHDLRRQALYTRAPTPPSGRWTPPPHTLRRDAPPVPRERRIESRPPRALRIGSPPPPPPPRVKTEEVDPELEAVCEASRQQMVEDERKRWDIVLANVAREREAALQAQQAAVLEEPQPWWQAMDEDLPPAPPLPEGLLGKQWVFNGGAWEGEEAQDQPPTPPAVVPPQAGGGPPAHLWQQPDYIILDGDDEEE